MNKDETTSWIEDILKGKQKHYEESRRLVRSEQRLYDYYDGCLYVVEEMLAEIRNEFGTETETK